MPDTEALLEALLQPIVARLVARELSAQGGIDQMPTPATLRITGGFGSVEHLCKAMNGLISKDTLYRYERGEVDDLEHKNVVDHMRDVAAKLGCTLSQYQRAVLRARAMTEARREKRAKAK